jgi:hypothetical protein
MASNGLSLPGGHVLPVEPVESLSIELARREEATVTRRPDQWHPGCCPELHFYGLRIAHCVACHQTFAGPHGFDTHKLIDGCKPPAECGMILRDTGVWHWPARESFTQWLAKI